MKKKILSSLRVSLGFLLIFLALPCAHVDAGESDLDFVSCGAWANCSTESPNYTGICCRPCKDREKGTVWDCWRVHDEVEPLGGPTGKQPTAGVATLTGIVTQEGVLQADQGREYAVSGKKAGEFQSNIGKKIEVKGTLQEAEGKVTIDVDAYELMGFEDTQAAAPTDTCSGWVNCDSRAPTFTGTCCRRCANADGGERWDCKVFSEGEHFDLAEWTHF